MPRSTPAGAPSRVEKGCDQMWQMWQLWWRKLGKHFCSAAAAFPSSACWCPRLRSSSAPLVVFTQSSLPTSKPYCFIKPYFHNKSLNTACLCLRLAPGPQITANRERNSSEQPPTSSPLHCFWDITEYIKIAENDNIAVIITLFVVAFFPPPPLPSIRIFEMMFCCGLQEKAANASPHNSENSQFPTEEWKRSLKGNSGMLNLNPIFSHECSRKTIS